MQELPETQAQASQVSLDCHCLNEATLGPMADLVGFGPARHESRPAHEFFLLEVAPGLSKAIEEVMRVCDRYTS